MSQSINIPPSSATVKVSIIDTNMTMVAGDSAPSAFFFGPPIRGFERWPGAIFAFLLTHVDENGKERKVLFDLGIAKNWKEDLPPHFVKEGYALGELVIEKYLSEVLVENGVELESIESMIWSHPHLDHVGKPSLFHPNTKLIVGPEVKTRYFPGYPVVEDAPVLTREFEGREVIELNFSNTGIEIGGFKALDFFGDGSLHLLEAPGHCLGHIVALVKTTPDSYILLGADSYHHVSQFRPSQHTPLPNDLTMPNVAVSPCPCDFFHSIHPAKNLKSIPEQYQKVWNPPNDDPSKTPFQTVNEDPSGKSQAYDVPATRRTLSKLQVFDAHPDIWVVTAHDGTIKDVADLFPKEANDWKKQGWKEQSRWKFLEHLVPAVELAQDSTSENVFL